MVIDSPNVDFSGSSTMHSPSLTDPDWHLVGLKEALDVCDPLQGKMDSSTGLDEMMRDVDGGESEWESDAKVLQLKVTEDEVVPNGNDPVVLLILREPEARIHGRC